ncbi:MAG: hypothetical protein IAC61_01060 [Firmicutes bacterium]|uniref:Uncharacterized protein n=1 Tax=Candidatus Alloenteromonas pullistercoris TaxID=2840785 RepID=A0A9D9DER7_9FIRM|nr:hypothetical protein [Candidatus Enteromonas pullistercoris]
MIEIKPKTAMESKEMEQVKKAIADKSEGWQKRAIEFYLNNAKPVKLTPDQVLEY